MSVTGHLFLVGFMGAGKSTVGRVIAERLGRPFVDCDEQVEAIASASISEIFARDGEAAFRDLESDALERLSESEPSVIACGGGAVIRDANRAAMRRTGSVIYLRVTPEEAIARIGDGATRPLLAGASGHLAATSLLAARESLYRSVADVTIDTVGKMPTAVAEEALRWLEENR